MSKDQFSIINRVYFRNEIPVEYAPLLGSFNFVLLTRETKFGWLKVDLLPPIRV